MGAHAEGLACRAQLSATLGAAVRALGPEQVLAVLPLRLEEGIDAEIEAKARLGPEADEDDRMDDDDHMDAELGADGGNVAGAAGARLWLVPLLRQALLGARLSYFAEELLPAARRLGARAAKAKAAGRAFEAQLAAQEGRVDFGVPLRRRVPSTVLHSQLRSQLDSQLHSQLHSQL